MSHCTDQCNEGFMPSTTNSEPRDYNPRDYEPRDYVRRNRPNVHRYDPYYQPIIYTIPQPQPQPLVYKPVIVTPPPKNSFLKDFSEAVRHAGIPYCVCLLLLILFAYAGYAAKGQ